MAVQSVFARREMKYLITRDQRDRIVAAMADYMRPDEFGRSIVCSMYYDTPTHLLIRRSLESPLYKEKLRIRSYGVAKQDGTVYVEVKKKFKGIVYKRRLGLSLERAVDWVENHDLKLERELSTRKAQIAKELDFFISRYEDLAPAMLISCEREAFYAVDDREFRVTFDENILARDWDLTLDRGVYGHELLSEGMVLMELKAGGAIPLWMAKLLSAEKIYKTKFSKYGTAFRRGNLRAIEYIEH